MYFEFIHIVILLNMSIELGETQIVDMPSVEPEQVDAETQMRISDPVVIQTQEPSVPTGPSKADQIKHFFMKDNKKMLYISIVVAVVVICIIISIIIIVKKNGDVADAEAEAADAKKAAEDAKASEKSSFWNGSFWGNKK
jgi:cell division protein FtsL